MTHHTDCTCCCTAPAASRRGFLQIAALGAGAALMAPMALPSVAHAAGNVDTLLLSCMDYRLMDEVAAYMQGKGKKDNYDHVVLAGAALGALVDAKPSWAATFWDHVEVAKQLHHISTVHIIDHRDCGAYKVFLGTDFGKEPDKETVVHTEMLQKLGMEVKKRHPDLKVELGLMGLDGKVETVRTVG